MRLWLVRCGRRFDGKRRHTGVFTFRPDRWTSDPSTLVFPFFRYLSTQTAASKPAIEIRQITGKLTDGQADANTRKHTHARKRTPEGLTGKKRTPLHTI